jgi:hypothetical protein
MTWSVRSGRPFTQPTGRAGRTAGWCFTVATFIPVAWLLAFAWLVLRARAVTGDWPAPYQPDPKAIGGITAIVVSGTLPLDDRKHETIGSMKGRSPG